MKTRKLSTLTKTTLLGILSAAMIFTFSSCARKATFQNSSVVPAARGSIKVVKDHNKNYVIYVDLFDLAEPGRLQPPKQVYVVWMVTDGNLTKNIGQIKTSTGLLSNALKGSLKAVSSFKPIQIFITAEDEAAVQLPGTLVVLSTNNF